LELDRGLTALVGPNNSGKSTILEFFYELRDVFAQMRGGMLRFTSSGSHNQPIVCTRRCSWIS
jgi:ABC-type cobalamin/Fe3+-siderophores transport system ATPase subunit